MGVDRSPAMLRQARRAIRPGAGQVDLVRADLRFLPFPAGSFDSATLTFPTPIIREAALWTELSRVVRGGGRVVVVLGTRSPQWKSVERRPLADYLPTGAFAFEKVDVDVDGSLVNLIVATVKPDLAT